MTGHDHHDDDVWRWSSAWDKWYKTQHRALWSCKHQRRWRGSRIIYKNRLISMVQCRLTFQLGSAHTKHHDLPSDPQVRSFWKFLNTIWNLLVSAFSVLLPHLSWICCLSICVISTFWVQSSAQDFLVRTGLLTNVSGLSTLQIGSFQEHHIEVQSEKKKKKRLVLYILMYWTVWNWTCSACSKFSTKLNQVFGLLFEDQYCHKGWIVWKNFFPVQVQGTCPLPLSLKECLYLLFLSDHWTFYTKT